MVNGWFETVAEAQRRAKKRLPASVYGALVAGSEKGLTVRDRRRLPVRQHDLRSLGRDSFRAAAGSS
jgi:hypothetical protein